MPGSIINIENLSVKFNNHTALENISLDFEEGSFISIVGPNGGGKSTLLKVLLGLYPDYTGNISIDGKKPNEVQSGLIGYVPQVKTHDRSFPAISIELVATGLNGRWNSFLKPEAKKICQAALEEVGAGHIAKRQLKALSGGELQRVYLARSIVRKPKLLLLDEPATGIDTAGETDFSHLIEHYKEKYGATVIMVTHDWEAAYNHADKVLLINRYLISYDTPVNVFRENNLRRAFGHIGHTHEMRFGAKE